MKTTVLILGLPLIFGALTLTAQEPTRPQIPAGSSPEVAAYFQSMDTNADGKLSRAEVESYQRLKSGFDYFDANRDGGISLEEMRAALSQWHGQQGQSQPAVSPPVVPPPSATESKPAPAGRAREAGRGTKHLVLISIDGCRPDYLTFADTPNLRALASAGTSYERAWVGQLRNDTPPGHVTLATGTFPKNHSVIGFHWQDPVSRQQFKPTTWFGVGRGQLNDLVAKSGCASIGSLYKKSFPGAKVAAFSSDKFYAAAALGADCADFIGYCRYDTASGFGTKVGQTLAPETVTGRQIPADILASPELTRKVANPWDGDTWTVDVALRLFEQECPEILLLNLALCDDTGHTHGAELGREQMAGIIANADRQLGRLMEAYRQAGIYDHTVWVITSDHGMSANLRTIDETPMAPIISEYDMKRSAARLEFYLSDPAKAREAAEKISRLTLPGIHAVYYKEKDGSGFRYLPAPGTAIDPHLDACYRYLTSTYASPQSVDLVGFPAENWNIQESASYFQGDHGTVTWENQHIPLFLAGPGIRKGLASLAPARLADIAPTILAAMGLLPAKMDGVVLADALEAPGAEWVNNQRAVTAQLSPLRDALQERHNQDAKAWPREVATQQPRRTASGGGAAGDAAQRFRQFDRNGDGKVTKEEAGNAPWFDWVDRNQDGVILPQELGQPTPGTPPRSAGEEKRKDETPPAASPESRPMKRAFTFTRDYTAGTKDANGQMRTGQELMSIRAYRGQLFAATSTFTDPRLYIEGDPDYTGCQVLRKSGPEAEWQVEASFGKRYLRTDYLEVVRFTRDANGKALAKPIELLVATVWDLGEIFRDSRVTGRNRRLTLAVRDDATGKWNLAPGPVVPDAERGFACIRSLKVHTDKVTGREYLFIAAGCGGMYKSVYDPGAQGGIRWLEGDELDKSYGRGQSMCVANGDLYVSYDYGGLLVQNQAGGVFHRIDGPEPRWERVYRNYSPNHPTWNQTGRGITAVPAEDGSGKEVILVGIENPPEPIIVRIEPHHGHRAVVELNYNEYFTRVFGRKPQMLGGSAQHPHAGNEIPALNRFDPFINPETGKLEHFVTLFLFHPDDPAEGCNNAYFLIRRAPGEYDWGEVTSGLPPGESLRGVRTIEKSPFPGEPQTYYFGGFFTGPDVQPPRPNLAWIFKGVVGKREAGSVKVAPPAPEIAPATYEDPARGLSFQYPGDLVRAKPGLLTMADNRVAPAIVVHAADARPVREVAAQAFREALGAPELIDYAETNLYLGSSTGVAGNLQPGGRVGKRFTCRFRSGESEPARAAVGMGWTESGSTAVIAVSYWGDSSAGMANVLLNKIIVSLKIERGAGPDRRAAGGATPPPRQGAGQFDAMLKSLDRNNDGKITRAEAGDAPWFGRVDQNQDGVLDAAELETVRKASGAWGGGGVPQNPPAGPQPPASPSGGGQLIERIKSLDKNGDGGITKEEAGAAPWFERVDQNRDGVLDASELEGLRQGSGG